MAMSEKSIEEYTMEMRERYARMTGRRAKTKLLDEFVEVTGWERKHANKVILETNLLDIQYLKKCLKLPYFQ
jgi:hypothetical protein